jgi:enterochelin esterase-like enzyme
MYKNNRLIFLIILFILLGALSCSKQKSSISKLNSFYSAKLKDNWIYKVYLPAGYSDDKEIHYPVIYLLHGSDGDENAWDFVFPILDSLIDRNDIPPTIAVVPVTGTSWWVDSDSIKYETAFFHDLIPEIDKEYKTISERRGRGIAGYSMGGYGALRYTLNYPEYFGAAMILSAAIYHNLPPNESSARTSGAFGFPFNEEIWTKKNFPALLESYLKNELYVPFFIATGDDDWNHIEGFEYNVEQQAVSLYGILHKEGGSPAELRIINGGHTKEVWIKLFVEGIQYMFHYLDYSK